MKTRVNMETVAVPTGLPKVYDDGREKFERRSQGAAQALLWTERLAAGGWAAKAREFVRRYQSTFGPTKTAIQDVLAGTKDNNVLGTADFRRWIDKQMKLPTSSLRE